MYVKEKNAVRIYSSIHSFIHFLYTCFLLNTLTGGTEAYTCCLQGESMLQPGQAANLLQRRQEQI